QPTRDGEPQPVMVGSLLYALGSDRKVHALNPRTGSDQVFEAGPGRRAVNFRASSSRLVVVTRTPNLATGLADTNLVGIDPSTRAIAWDQPLGTDVFTNSIEVDTDTVYLGVGTASTARSGTSSVTAAPPRLCTHAYGPTPSAAVRLAGSRRCPS